MRNRNLTYMAAMGAETQNSSSGRGKPKKSSTSSMMYCGDCKTAWAENKQAAACALPDDQRGTVLALKVTSPEAAPPSLWEDAATNNAGNTSNCKRTRRDQDIQSGSPDPRNRQANTDSLRTECNLLNHHLRQPECRSLQEPLSVRRGRVKRVCTEEHPDQRVSAASYTTARNQSGIAGAQITR